MPENIIEEYSRQVSAMTTKDDYARLTDREREVLQLVAEGRSNREIALLLHITTKTVEAHRSRMVITLSAKADSFSGHALPIGTRFVLKARSEP